MQKSTPIVGIPAEVNTPSVYRLTMLVFPTPASPIRTILNRKSYSVSIEAVYKSSAVAIAFKIVFNQDAFVSQNDHTSSRALLS